MSSNSARILVRFAARESTRFGEASAARAAEPIIVKRLFGAAFIFARFERQMDRCGALEDW
jgi:hypothetical protein